MFIGINIGIPMMPPAPPVNDYRNAMPAGSTYTRTGAATGLTVAGGIQNFAADAPQRTDRGLAIEPARTNLLLRSQQLANAYWTQSLVSTVDNQVVSPDGATTAATVTTAATTGQLQSTSVTINSGSTQVFTAFFKAGTSTSASLILFVSGASYIEVTFNLLTGVVSAGPSITGASFSGASGSVLAVGSGFYMVRLIVTTSGITSFTAWLRVVGASVVNLSTWQADLQQGSFVTSPIPTTSASATRGLPVFTEPVPAGRTKALLTYADASTTLVTGLTPGGTFDVATAVLGANKGRFGASELVTREWQA